LQDVFGRSDDSLFKAASGLSGGIGRMRDTCGSLLGASLMLGTHYGRGREELDDVEKMHRSYIPVGKLYRWFEQEFGSATCREILSRKTDPTEDCRKLVGNTAARTAEMLWDAINDDGNR
jgi:C_GCAxxG_C_C family probable redox protein